MNRLYEQQLSDWHYQVIKFYFIGDRYRVHRLGSLFSNWQPLFKELAPVSLEIRSGLTTIRIY